jgi:Flp pilus assembly protein TadG
MIRRPVGDGDTGVAAVEFALVFSLLLVVVALVWPIGELLLQKMALDRAMSDTIRYATTAPSYPEDNADGTSSTVRRPTCQQVDQEFAHAYGGGATTSDFSQMALSGTVSGVPTSDLCPNGPHGLRSGDTVTITVSKTVSLGPLGDLLSIAGITHSSSVTVSAGASGREE